ncbi:1-phosphofructokinase family hexose kinase [Albimonas pacifica]|uniref:Phosphofructokinase n=1 Tax=Albimonas pacifica TaxID=1114924 RepID=A0A1I3C0D9_9RHOB|nr:hexose kinase [Albimonas pacifica]SFH67940.1 6-phosphofructokinase [Albimonas pacifica]
MSRILTVTLNPALDLTTGVARLEEGRKMRCEPPQMDPGGGGANVSRAIRKLGGASEAFICTGAPLGTTYRERFAAEGLAAIWHDCGVPTRQSIAVHDRATGGQYRFVFPGELWGEPVWQGALDALTAAMRPGDLVVLSGSQPPGVPEDFPRRLCAMAGRVGAKVIVDTSGRPLEVAAQPNTGAHVLRMDHYEGMELMGWTEFGPREAETLARELVDRGAAEIAIVTLGGDGAWAATAEEAWHCAPPAVEVLSSTGAGDSFVAALSIGLSDGRPFVEAIAFAVAAAADAVTTPGTDLCTLDGTLEKLARVTRARF